MTHPRTHAEWKHTYTECTTASLESFRKRYYYNSVPKYVKTTQKILHKQNNSFLNFHIIIITFSQELILDLVRDILILVPFTHTPIRWRKQRSSYDLQTPTTFLVSSSTMTWLPSKHLRATTLLRDFCLYALYLFTA